MTLVPYQCPRCGQTAHVTDRATRVTCNAPRHRTPVAMVRAGDEGAGGPEKPPTRVGDCRGKDDPGDAANVPGSDQENSGGSPDDQ